MIDDMALDILLLEHTMKPEAVQVSPLNDHQWIEKASEGKCPGANNRKAAQQTGNITAVHGVAGHLVVARGEQRGHQSGRAAEFERDKDRVKIGSNSLRGANQVRGKSHDYLHKKRWRFTLLQ